MIDREMTLSFTPKAEEVLKTSGVEGFDSLLVKVFGGETVVFYTEYDNVDEHAFKYRVVHLGKKLAELAKKQGGIK